jgi:hypothetical protein
MSRSLQRNSRSVVFGSDVFMMAVPFLVVESHTPFDAAVAQF